MILEKCLGRATFLILNYYDPVKTDCWKGVKPHIEHRFNVSRSILHAYQVIHTLPKKVMLLRRSVVPDKIS